MCGSVADRTSHVLNQILLLNHNPNHNHNLNPTSLKLPQRSRGDRDATFGRNQITYWVRSPSPATLVNDDSPNDLSPQAGRSGDPDGRAERCAISQTVMFLARPSDATKWCATGLPVLFLIATCTSKRHPNSAILPACVGKKSHIEVHRATSNN